MESKWPKKTVQEGSECGFCQREVQTNCQDENNVEFVSKICSNKIGGS